MQNRTMMMLGATRLLVWGVILVGPLVAAVVILSHVREVLKPFAALYQINTGQAQPKNKTSAPIQLPSVKLPSLNGSLNANQLQSSLAALQRQLGEAAKPVPAAVPVRPSVDEKELAELRQQLQAAQKQIEQLNIALADQAKMVDSLRAKARAEQANQQPAMARLSEKAAAYIAERIAYGTAVQQRDDAEKALEKIQANPKTTPRQIYVASYNLMMRRAQVMRLMYHHPESAPAIAPDYAVKDIPYRQAMAALAKARADVQTRQQQVVARLENEKAYQSRLLQKYRDADALQQLKLHFAPQTAVLKIAQKLMADRAELTRMQSRALLDDPQYQLARKTVDQSTSVVVAMRKQMSTVASARR